MKFEEMDNVLTEAEQIINIALYRVQRMARIISGKLQAGQVGHSDLRKLKNELKRYNIQTRQWGE